MKNLKNIFVISLLVFCFAAGSATVFAAEWSTYAIEKKAPVAITPEKMAKMTMEDFQKIAEEIGPETLVGAKGEGAGLTIAFSQRGLAGSEWWENLVRLAKEEADWLGVRLTVIDADRREEKQMADLLSILGTKPDALILNPQHPSALLRALDRYEAAGIPVFVVNSDIDARAKVVSFVSGDSFEMGYKLGWEVGAEVNKRGITGEVKALHVSGFPGDLVSKNRRLGIVAGFFEQQFQTNGKAHLNVVSQQYGNWLPEPSMKITQDVLSAHPDVQVVFAECDGTAQGVIAALEAAGKLDSIIGGSIDGRKQILKRVSEGDWHVDVMQDPRHQGKWVVYFAVQHLLGNPVPSTFWIPTPPATKSVAEQYYHPDSAF